MKKKIFISVQMIRDIGGISSSILNLLDELHCKYDITLCVSGNYISPNIKIPENVSVIKGSTLIRDAIIDRRMLCHQNVFPKVKRIIIRFLRRRVGMEKIIEWGLKSINISGEYDVAIAFAHDRYYKGRLMEGGDYGLVLNKVKAKRKVAWMHTDLRQEGYDHNVCMKAYRGFDAIVNVSKDNKKLFDTMAPEFTNKSYVVYNTYNIQSMKEKAKEYIPFSDDGKLHIVTVARVTRQKKMDRIVKSCRRLKEDGYTNFIWYIVGDGDEMEKMQRLAKENNITDIISFEGLKTNPYPYMYYADVFVLTSYFEGYGMTPRESQVLGCPALITNFGPAPEVVENGVTGIICENSTEGVYTMMKSILDKPSKIEMFRNNLKEHPITNDVALLQFKEACAL